MSTHASEAGESGSRSQTITAILVAAASLGLQVAVPLVWPNLDRRIGIALLALSVLGFILAGVLFYRGRSLGPKRRWMVLGMGQGWLETRVRNNAGDALNVTSNPGGDANQIAISVNFNKRTRPRRSDTVELIFDVDGTSFEWDVPDLAETAFTLEAVGWSSVQSVKTMLRAMRQGTTVKVLIPSLKLSARFTLLDAFDVLQDAATLGEAAEATAPVLPA
jgi:hypothetical protein